jgi:hypothetical protein
MVDARSGDIADSLNEVSGIVNIVDPIGNKEYNEDKLLTVCFAVNLMTASLITHLT